MDLRLEKINAVKRQSRFYHLSIAQTLFGEWCLVRQWGRIGACGGQCQIQYLPSKTEALAALSLLKTQKQRRGYASIPVQLHLFERSVY